MSDATGDAGQPHGAAIEDYLAELRTFPPPEGFARTAVVSRPSDVPSTPPPTRRASGPSRPGP